MNEEQPLPQIGPGQLLREARESLNLSTQDIADKIRLKNSLIQDIELDHYDFNISLTFIKGYLKLYAKQVGVSENSVIKAFDSLNTQKKEPAKLQSFSKRIANQAHDDKLMLVTYLIVGVVIALVVVWWFQQSNSTSAINTLRPPATADNPAMQNTTEVLAGSSAQESSMDDTVDDYSAQASEIEGVTSAEEGLQNSLATAQNGDIDGQADDNPVLTAGPAEGEAVKVNLVFSFSTDCWMKLTDATGEDIAYGTKTQGRVMPVSGVPPFAVILCAPEAVKIDYNGEPVDLSGFRIGSTAKFNLPFSE